MDRIFYILMVLVCVFGKAQNHDYWLIDKETKHKNIVKDSASAVKFLDSLSQTSFFFTNLQSVNKLDRHTEIVYDKGPNFNQAEVKFSDSLVKDLGFPKVLYVKNIDSLRQKINQKYRDKGFAFNRVKTKFLKMNAKTPEIEISVVPASQRKINGFVLKGYDKVPARFMKNLEKSYLGKVYDDKNLVSINNALVGHPYILLE